MFDRLLAGVIACLIVGGCSGDALPSLTPSLIELGDEAQPLRIVGLSPADYLQTASSTLVLAPGYRAQIGGNDTLVASANGTGVTVSLAVPLAVGSYALDVVSGERTWHVDDALAIVAAGTSVDGAAACPSAPLGCTSFGCGGSSHCYYVCAAASFSAAEAHCRALGIGCLATISNAAENDCVQQATTPSAADPIWIGFEQSNNASEPAGGWDWACPDGSQFTNWATSQPDDSDPTSNCGALVGGGTWDDTGCNLGLRYLCELAP